MGGIAVQNKTTWLGIFISLIIGVALFKIKYEVIAVAGALDKVQNEILRTEESIHLLQAEWAYLNEPSRLQKLANEHLHMTATKTNQIIRDDKIIQCLHELGKNNNNGPKVILTSGEE